MFNKAAKRNFLRRTKATAPPETAETETATDKTETTTNKFTRRGSSKFKSRKEAELEKKTTVKNDVENTSRRTSLNGGARRSERPTRKFVRVRAGGANATSTISPISSTSALPARRPFRVAARRRPSSTTTTTTTTVVPTTSSVPTTTEAQAVTNAYDDEESLQDIGDFDAIEDPTLEPKVPKKNYKVQRRPLVNLKDDVKDQNPSATNDEERKRQSKKYSSTIKQNQLNDLLKLRSQEETTTETKTTVEEISPETAIAIAAHQLITAPLPSVQNYEEDDVKPTRKTQTTVEYKYSNREYNEYTGSQTPSYEEYQSTPIYKGTVGSEVTTAYKNPTNFDYETPKSPVTSTGLYKTDFVSPTTSAETASDFDAPKISTVTYDVPKSTVFPNTANTANLDYVRTTSNDYSLSSQYVSPKVTPASFSPRSPSTVFPNTATNQEYVSTLTDGYDTRSDFDSKVSSYLPKSTNFPTNTIPQEYIRTTSNTYPSTSEYISKNSPTYVPKFPSTDYPNTISQEFVRSTINPYDNTATDDNAPRISTTLAPAVSTPTRYFDRTTFADTATDSPRVSTSFVPQTTAATKFSRGGSRYSATPASDEVTGFTGVQRGFTSRYRNEKLIPVPVENTGYSTARYTGPSQEPAYFTREYLLESPVTKTYDAEYQYLSPITTPVTTPQTPAPTSRKVIRKKVQRKISTTLRPTTEAAAPVSTTLTPRRVPSKQPFEKIPKGPKNKYRPIENYDYYDDSDEKVAIKYAEGTKIVMHENGHIECLDIGNFPHPKSCKKFISCARIENGSLLGWEYVCPKGLSFDPVGGICNWSAGLGCNEKDV